MPVTASYPGSPGRSRLVLVRHSSSPVCGDTAVTRPSDRVNSSMPPVRAARPRPFSPGLVRTRVPVSRSMSRIVSYVGSLPGVASVSSVPSATRTRSDCFTPRRTLFSGTFTVLAEPSARSTTRTRDSEFVALASRVTGRQCAYVPAPAVVNVQWW